MTTTLTATAPAITARSASHYIIDFADTTRGSIYTQGKTPRSRAPLTTIDPAMSQARGRLPNGRGTRGNAKGADGGSGSVNGWGGKRKAAEYDEDVEGFQFTRASAPKKSKPAIDENTIPQPPTEDGDTHHQPVRKKGRPPKATEAPRAASSETPNGKLPARSQRRTSKRLAEEEQTVPVAEKRSRSRRISSDTEPAPITIPKKRGPAKTQDSQQQQQRAPQRWEPEDEGAAATPPAAETNTQKIALPFADTPVMRRNKEMRKEKSQKGQRRSSLGMRGRRASSLIESGASNALPHDEVDTAHFYKHIESEGLSEPRRMRQLLTWCATRALGEKPSGSRSGDESARLAARVIQEEILNEISNRSELSDWFGREETTPPAVVVRKPNPRNILNEEKIKELEEQIHKLQLERQSLTALLRPPSIPRIRPPASTSEQPSSTQQSSSTDQQKLTDQEPINSSLLDPSQQAILNTLNPYTSTSTSVSSADKPAPTSQQTDTSPTSISAISSRLSRLTTSLIPTLDSFAEGVHDIELFRHAADDVAGQVLKICARRLEERDRLRSIRGDGEEVGGSSSRTRRRKGKEKGGDVVEEDDGGGYERGEVAKDRIEKEDLAVVLAALSRLER
ncbi:hypothetical protein AJ79_00431 [Helicocarpus griseus UAMH5409]|uniref:Mis12-Mtw1 family protein n=1 Tax=Helicocarpus griseus UAMH5409 TaxID=1447875 RepID=A0A2B7YAT6_9EURO|nr:hypothetical protein AJ79_00431 [Helicocarpus griseus UAMH5409]